MVRFKSVSLCLILVLFLSVFQAAAFDIYFFGSYWEKEDADEGNWGGGLGLSLPLFTGYLRLDSRAYYFESSDLADGNELSVIPFDLGLQLHLLPDAVLDPYLLGGASYIYADADEADADSDFGGYAGIGLEWSLPSSATLKVFGEALYRFHELDVDPVEDFDVSGFAGNIGIKLHF